MYLECCRYLSAKDYLIIWRNVIYCRRLMHDSELTCSSIVYRPRVLTLLASSAEHLNRHTRTYLLVFCCSRVRLTTAVNFTLMRSLSGKSACFYFTGTVFFIRRNICTVIFQLHLKKNLELGLGLALFAAVYYGIFYYYTFQLYWNGLRLCLHPCLTSLHRSD